MGKIEKQLRSIPNQYRERVFRVIEKLIKRDFEGLNRIKLKEYECIYRVRVGNYRIMYHDDGENIILKAISKRDETTYNNF